MSGIKVSVLSYPPTDNQKLNNEQRLFVDLMHETMASLVDTEDRWKGRNIGYRAPFKVHGYFAEVDLEKVQVIVSSNRNHPTAGTPDGLAVSATAVGEMAMCTTEEWAEHNRTILALNANFYDIKKGSGIDLYNLGHTRTDGLSLSQGTIDQQPVSNAPPNRNPKGCLSLLFDTDNIAYLKENYRETDHHPISRDQSAVTIENFFNGVAGTWLLKFGNPPTKLEPEPEGRHARLAIGFPGSNLKFFSDKLYVVMIELQTAMDRARDYLIGKIDFDEAALKIIAPVPFQPFSDDQQLEEGTKRPFPVELKGILTFINQKKSVGESDLTPEGCTISSTVEDEWDKPDEKAASAPMPFMQRKGFVKNAWKIKGPQENQVYVLRFKAGKLAIFWKTRFRQSLTFEQLKAKGFTAEEANEYLQHFGIGEFTRTRGYDVSVGMTLYELASYMQQLGVKNAINLDGSGSASFIYTPANNPAGEIKNVFHDGRPASDDNPIGMNNKKAVYYCPDHTELESDRPGKCSKIIKVYYLCPDHTQFKSENSGNCPECDKVLIREHQRCGKDRLPRVEFEMYHLEQFFRPRPAANHLGFKDK